MAVITDSPSAAGDEIRERSAEEPAILGHGGPPPWLRKLGRLALGVAAIGALVYLFVPIVVVVVYSFNKPLGKYNYVWHQFSLDAWTDPFRYPELRDALSLSLKVALVVTLVSVVLGTLIALAMVKYRFKAKGLVGTILVLPLTMPEVVMGFSLLTWFVALNWSRGFVTIIIAQVMFSISYVATTVRARIRGFEWRLEEAALDLGAKPLRVFAKVTFPLILPGILAAALLTFALSLDDFIITYLNSGIEQTFPIEIWTLKKSRIPPQINVFATTILLVSVILALLGVYLGFRRSKKLGQLNP
ncbi:MAG: ABC transporter permease [Acidimicrobiales bacterium]